MHNNQITENIACNSEYYNKILDDNIRNQKFHKLLKNIETDNPIYNFYVKIIDPRGKLVY